MERQHFECIANREGVYCQHMKTVDVNPEDEHQIVERSDTSYTCAWCTKHNCPCKDLDYRCKDILPVKGHWDENMNWIETEVKI